MKTVFVSSTFRDFQYERDLLRRKVQPLINNTAYSFGDSMSFCDLRWGIDTDGMEENESAIKVLSVCLNEIDRSRPYMIVLLGDRYGYCPGQDLISYEANRHSLILDEYDISVTQLEIEYGVFLGLSPIDHVYFYFRHIEGDPDSVFLSENKKSRARMDALKRRIIKRIPNNVREYTVFYRDHSLYGFDSFLNQVSKDIETALLGEWNKYANMSLQEKERIVHWQLIEQKAAFFSLFYNFVGEVISQLTSEKQEKAIWLRGKSGSGKSTLFSYVCCKLRDLGLPIFPITAGNTALSANGFEILRSWVWQVEDYLKQSHAENDMDLQQLMTRMTELSRLSEHPLILSLDAINQLEDPDAIHHLSFLPNTSDQIKLLITSTDPAPSLFSAKELVMPAVKNEEVVDLITHILHRIGRELSPIVLRTLSNKSSTHTPMYLHMAILYLCLMDSRDFQQIDKMGNGQKAINAVQQDILKSMPNGLGELAVSLFQRLTNDISPHMMTALNLLACSRHGLRYIDLEHAMNSLCDNQHFNELLFSQVVNYLSDMFILRDDGRYDFMHPSSREGILNSLEDGGHQYQQLLLNVIDQLPHDDPIRIKEYTWHCIACNDIGKLQEYIEFCVNANHKTALLAIANDMYISCISGNAQMLITLIEATNDSNQASAILRLTEDYIIPFFRKNPDHLSIGYDFLEAASKRASKLFLDFPSSNNKVRILSLRQTMLSWDSDIQEASTALSRLENNLDELHKLYELTGRNDHDICDIYSHALLLSANVHVLDKSRESYGKANKWYREYLQLIKHKAYISLNSDRSDAVCGLAYLWVCDPSIGDGQEQLNMCETELNDVIQNTTLEDSEKTIIQIKLLLSIASIEEMQNTRHSLSKAWQHACKATELLKILMNRSSDLNNLALATQSAIICVAVARKKHDAQLSSIARNTLVLYLDKLREINGHDYEPLSQSNKRIICQGLLELSHSLESEEKYFPSYMMAVDAIRILDDDGRGQHSNAGLLLLTEAHMRAIRASCHLEEKDHIMSNSVYLAIGELELMGNRCGRLDCMEADRLIAQVRYVYCQALHTYQDPYNNIDYVERSTLKALLAIPVMHPFTEEDKMYLMISDSILARMIRDVRPRYEDIGNIILHRLSIIELLLSEYRSHYLRDYADTCLDLGILYANHLNNRNAARELFQKAKNVYSELHDADKEQLLSSFLM
ncbi:MAG: DUF4062 domain-containing protein [Prevotella sp.]|nr:DUF4062 domain-containing protein [Prevotella sp.]